MQVTPYTPAEIGILVALFARQLVLVDTPTDFSKAVKMAKEIRRGT